MNPQLPRPAGAAPGDARRASPAAERNRGPILAELRRVLPASGRMLEIAAGTGQHAAHLAAGLPGWRWQPTDGDPAALASIAAWCAGLAGVEPPRRLDVLDEPWPGEAPGARDAVFCANMVHVAPWPCCAALMRGAARVLAPDGVLVTYGPHVEDDVPTAAGNLAFDADLRAREPAWGLRRLADVRDAARSAGLGLRERVAMPANNLLLVWAAAPRGADAAACAPLSAAPAARRSGTRACRAPSRRTPSRR